jgi:hypothetical protein
MRGNLAITESVTLVSKSGISPVIVTTRRHPSNVIIVRRQVILQGTVEPYKTRIQIRRHVAIATKQVTQLKTVALDQTTAKPTATTALEQGTQKKIV